MRNSILKSYLKKFIKNEAFVSVAIVFVLAIGIIGTSYALYMDVDTDVNYQLVEVGDLSVGFDNGNNTFTLNYLTPTDDDIATNKVESEIGKEISKYNFFSFYIYNNGNYTANYDIKLVPQEGSISSEFLRYQICKDNIENCRDINTLNDATNNVIFNDELNPNRTDSQTNPSAYYFLRVWVKNDYIPSENDKVILKVEIDAKNASGYLDNDNTLVGKLLSDERVKINNTVPSFTMNADYVVKGNEDSGELGLFKASDDYGISYYYRGAQSYNYVNFAGFTWRVVRINGDGTIRLILDGTLDKVCAQYESDGTTCETYAGTTSLFNNVSNNNAYVGYIYGMSLSDTSNNIRNRCLKLNENNEITDYLNDFNTRDKCELNGGKWATNSYEATHANVKDSIIKTNVDTFYEKYLMSFENYIADSIFCSDKSVKNSDYLNFGFGTLVTQYKTLSRVKYNVSDNIVVESAPSLKCDDISSRNSVISNKIYSNGDLTYPIALITVDEMIMAGGFLTKGNSKYYLYNENTSNYWWTMSPYEFKDNKAINVSVQSNGAIITSEVTSDIGVRPVINLKADVIYKTGDGTSKTPYEIK